MSSIDTVENIDKTITYTIITTTGYSIENDPAKRWARRTWIMLHTLANKVKDEDFYLIKDELIRHIYEICTNLPCESCSLPAKLYLDGIDTSAINSRYNLQRMLFNFHNEVNIKVNKPLLSLCELDNLYNDLNLTDIVNDFNLNYKFTSHDKRHEIAGSFMKWITLNISRFRV